MAKKRKKLPRRTKAPRASRVPRARRLRQRRVVLELIVGHQPRRVESLRSAIRPRRDRPVAGFYPGVVTDIQEAVLLGCHRLSTAAQAIMEPYDLFRPEIDRILLRPLSFQNQGGGLYWLK